MRVGVLPVPDEANKRNERSDRSATSLTVQPVAAVVLALVRFWPADAASVAR
jgi:hypothetical protein